VGRPQTRCTILPVPDILLATDSDWLTDEVEAAIAGPHLLHRVRAGVGVVPAIEHIEPALVLLDLQIGNMGGIAACLAVRHREEMGDLNKRPIMLLLDREVDVFLANEARADGYLVKPLDPFSLLRAVESTLATA
jgi:DNA-binding response OmpR family regulator